MRPCSDILDVKLIQRLQLIVRAWSALIRIRTHGGPDRFVVDGVVDLGWHSLSVAQRLRLHSLALLSIPIVRCGFQLQNPRFKHLFVPDKLLQFEVGVFPRKVLKYLQPFPEIVIFILQLENFRVLLVNELRLFLDGLPEP